MKNLTPTIRAKRIWQKMMTTPLDKTGSKEIIAAIAQEIHEAEERGRRVHVTAFSKKALEQIHEVVMNNIEHSRR